VPVPSTHRLSKLPLVRKATASQVRTPLRALIWLCQLSLQPLRKGPSLPEYRLWVVSAAGSLNRAVLLFCTLL
jgi:hypothetical protein